MREDTVQEAVWSRQFFILSSDESLEGWYDENASLPVDSTTEGIIVPKHQEFSANGEVISELFKITGPLTISSTWNYSLTTLAVAGISSSSIGFTAWSIMRRVTGLKGKREKVEEEGKKPEKRGEGRFASLSKLGSRFKREKSEKVMEVKDPSSDESRRQALSNLMKMRMRNRNVNTAEDA